MQIFQIVLALSILILVHELGHFTFARIFGIRIDKFFLFFDARGIKLFSTRSKWFLKLFPKAADWETEYGIGWLPLGGYCKVNGMIDESMDTEFTKSEPKPWEFRSKPAWQRLLVMAGGVLFNFILGIMLYSFVLCKWGEAYYPAEGNSVYVYENSLAADMGFKTGDRIIALDGEKPKEFFNMQVTMARDMVRKATVIRDNDTISIHIDQKYIADLLGTPLFDIAVPFTILDMVPESQNSKVDILPGDRIIRIDSTDVTYAQDVFPILEKNAGKEITATIMRDSTTLTRTLAVDKDGNIGVYLQLPPIVKHRYSFWESIPAGCAKAYEAIVGQLKDLRLVAKPSTGAYKQVRSVIGMTEIMPVAWDWRIFIHILAMISIVLGVMNLLPIPALDGGHIVFTIYEMITGKKPSDNFMYVMQLIGMVLIFGLMFIACGNDILRLTR
ncbi:MAG: RIP metalloprotease RseP [Bacteroidales bacterium]|nr:RIP metalloprotease RseP [Bacteroidales bacterium]